MPALLSLSMFTSCSLVKSTTLNITGELISDGSDEVFTEANLEFFKKAVPGNLKLIEGLWFGEQDNEVLLLMLIKGHAGYTFASTETDSYREILLEEDSYKREQTLLSYEKAIYYGHKYLALKGISKDEFYKKEFPQHLVKRFETELDATDYPAIFYFAQALGSSINLQRQNIKKMANLNHVKTMLNWVCAKDPSMEGGNCRLFQRIIEASTPTILGGSPKKAKNLFKSFMNDYPFNLLARLSYIQFHLIPLLEEDEYTIEMQKLKKDIDLWYQFQVGNINKANSGFAKARQFNLYNAVAKERFHILKKLEKEIF